MDKGYLLYSQNTRLYVDELGHCYIPGDKSILRLITNSEAARRITFEKLNCKNTPELMGMVQKVESVVGQKEMVKAYMRTNKDINPF